ncbi:MAG: hypothetical protein ACR2G4_05070 [Pyrinomonadaceae bacterium]
MTVINAEAFEQLCDGVWRDRAGVLTGRGSLSGEAVLIRAVYWRLCKAGIEPDQHGDDYHTGQMLPTYRRLVGALLAQHAHPPFDESPFLAELLRRYRDEAGES